MKNLKEFSTKALSGGKTYYSNVWGEINPNVGGLNHYGAIIAEEKTSWIDDSSEIENFISKFIKENIEKEIKLGAILFSNVIGTDFVLRLVVPNLTMENAASKAFDIGNSSLISFATGSVFETPTKQTSGTGSQNASYNKMTNEKLSSGRFFTQKNNFLLPK
jgi:hypothetical protein